MHACIQIKARRSGEHPRFRPDGWFLRTSSKKFKEALGILQMRIKQDPCLLLFLPPKRLKHDSAHNSRHSNKHPKAIVHHQAIQSHHPPPPLPHKPPTPPSHPEQLNFHMIKLPHSSTPPPHEHLASPTLTFPMPSPPRHDALNLTRSIFNLRSTSPFTPTAGEATVAEIAIASQAAHPLRRRQPAHFAVKQPGDLETHGGID